VALALFRQKAKPQLNDEEKRMELTEHLAELRSRIIRTILYVTAGASICYFYFKPIYAFLFYPMQRAIEGRADWKIVFTHFPQAFFVVLQISIVAGLIVVAPLVTYEMWAFLAPALTREEKKPLRYVAPLSVALFMGGVALAYWVAQFAIQWFVGYVSWFPNGVLYQDPKAYVMFILKAMGIFGLVFQLPIVLMFLAWIGILRSEGMKKSWRTAVVGISVVGLFLTPSNDAFTMLMMIIPVIGLYLGSIWLVQVIERSREKRMQA
jgi:sec-independent protein translocase protein TatC